MTADTPLGDTSELNSTTEVSKAGDALLARMLHEPAITLVEEATSLACHWPNDERTIVIAATVLKKAGEVDSSLKLLLEYFAKVPGSAVVSANIAAAYESKGNYAEASQYYWTSAQLTPNYLPAVAGYAQCARKQAGEDGYWNALQQLAAIPGAWAAPLIILQEDIKHRRRSTVVRSCKRLLTVIGDDPTALDALIGELYRGECFEELNSLASLMNLSRATEQACKYLLDASMRCHDNSAARSIIDRSPEAYRTELHATLLYAQSTAVSNVTKAQSADLALMLIDTAPWYELLGRPDWLFPENREDMPWVVFAPFAAPARAAGIVNTTPFNSLMRTVPFIIGESLHRLGVCCGASLLLLAERYIPAVPSNEVSFDELRAMLRSTAFNPAISVTAALTATAQGLSFSYHLHHAPGSKPPRSLHKSFAIVDLRSALTVVAALEQDISSTLNLQPVQRAISGVEAPPSLAVINCSEHLLRALIAIRTAHGQTPNGSYLPLHELFVTLQEQDGALYWQVQRAAAVVAASSLGVSGLQLQLSEIACNFQIIDKSDLVSVTLGLLVRKHAGGDATLSSDIEYVRINANKQVINWMSRMSLL